MRPRNSVWTFFSLALLTTTSLAQHTSEGLPLNSRIGMSAGSYAHYGKLPLLFEQNQGQADLQTKFLLRGKGYTAFLASDGMLLSLRPTNAAPIPRIGNVPATTSASSVPPTAIQFRLSGATRNPAVAGEDRQLGKVNYFFGRDPNTWRTNVPTYARVRYKDVYPGIDLVYYGTGRQLECDFAIAPGADPNRIQFEITGAREIRVDVSGNLVLSTNSGDLRFEIPVVYQESNGQHIVIDGGYVVNDPTHVSFHLAHYDPKKPMVIDPVLVYSTYLGGSGFDQPEAIAVDSSGSIYVAGYTDSADFPLAALGSLPTGMDHVFVAKLDPSGSTLLYADYIGGSSPDFGYALALDSANHVYVAGATESTDFPVVSPYQASLPGRLNVFVTKISADGSSLLYSTYLGGDSAEAPSSIQVGSAGEMYVAGYTSSTNFPVANAYQATVSPNQGGAYGTYGFLTKLTSDGSSLVYSTFIGGNSNVPQSCAQGLCWPAPLNLINGMALDSSGNAYVTGDTNTYNFPATPGAYLTTNSAPLDATIGFVSKFSTSGSLDYSTYLYGSSGASAQIASIAVDGAGSAYITGTAPSDGTFPITSTSICDPAVSFGGCSYAFVTKFDPTGSTLQYSTFLGLNNVAFPQAVAVDQSNDAYVLCVTWSGTVATPNGIEPYDNGADLLVAEIDPVASTQLFATFLGASGDEYPAGLKVDSNGNVYVSGYTDSTDFPVTQGAFQNMIGGNFDAFVVKIGPSSAPAVSVSPVMLQYPIQPVGSSSQAQVILLRNMGSSPLSISSSTIAGDFAETDNCGTSVPAAASCTFSVTFTPTGPGTRSGSLLIQDDATGSPHVISLGGTGSGAVAALSPANLAFSAQPLGTFSAPQAVTLTNAGNTTLNVGNIQVTGDYAQTNTCPAAVTAGSSCAINVTFTPTASGTRNGTLTMSDNAHGSPQVVTLAGAGADFGITSSPSTDTLKAGATATYQVAVSPLGGAFTNIVKVTCSGAPALTTCKASPNAVTPNGSAAISTLTITTTASVAQAVPLRSSPDRMVYAIWMPGVSLFGMILAGQRARSRKLRLTPLLFLMTAGLIFMASCAGGTGIKTPHQNGTAPGTYTITVTGASGALQHSIPVTLIVQ